MHAADAVIYEPLTLFGGVLNDAVVDELSLEFIAVSSTTSLYVTHHSVSATVTTACSRSLGPEVKERSQVK